MRYERGREAVVDVSGVLEVEALPGGKRLSIPAHRFSIDLDQGAADAVAALLTGRHGPLPGY